MSSRADLGGISLVDVLSVVLLMRVHALWKKNKILGIVLAVLAVVSISLGVALLQVQPGVSEFIGTLRCSLTFLLGFDKIRSAS